MLPGGKRALITAMEGLFAFTDDQRMALVFDFTPASSVTVVDLVKRQVFGEIDIPGCSLVYPSGARGFSTLCSSGTLLTIRLDANGQVAGRSESKAFNPLDTDPLFTASASVGRRALFPEPARAHPADRHEDGGREGTARLAVGDGRGKGGAMAAERLADHRERRAKSCSMC